MKKKWTMILFLGVAVTCYGVPENIALNKPYTLSPVPKYEFCTDLNDKVQLTDGVYAKNGFWVQKETVGWVRVAPVICMIDLGKVEPICGVSWSTAAGVAEVTWPQSLQVLASEDKKFWTYLGDLCELGTETQSPPAEGYATFRYASDRMKGRGRYVCVIAKAEPFCFVDEIEVWRGPDEWLQGEMPGHRTDDIERFYVESRVRMGLSIRLREDLQAIESQAAALGFAEVATELKVKAEELRGKVPAEAENVPTTLQTVLPFDGLHKKILALNAPLLRAAGVKEPLVWKNNRWDPLALMTVPSQVQQAGVDMIYFDLMRGEVRGETFNITNPQDNDCVLELKVSGIPDEVNLELREVLFTDTRSLNPVAAALRRIEPDAKGLRRLMIPAGCTRQVWISCQRPGGKAKTYKGKIHLASNGVPLKKNLALHVRIRNLDFPKQPFMHVGGWDYTQGKADSYKAPGNLAANLALMREMYVDSPWATQAVFPKGAVFNAEGRLQNGDALDFALWDAWVARWKEARNYCVFFNVGSSFNGEKMGTPRFSIMIDTWLGAWVRHLEKQGLKAGQLVILLVDEPHKLSHDEVVVIWAKAIRAANLGVVIFENPAYQDPSEGNPGMFALCDVLCPHTPVMVRKGKPFRDFYLRQKEAGKTLWLYSAVGPAKLLDPITYHRAQAWLAFQIGAEGTFFWAFGCGGGIGDSWQAYAQAHMDYSPYFVGPDSVMEGKHSEAVREGVQDYEYLLMLRNKATKIRRSNGDAAWLKRVESLLTDGVAEALEAVTSPNMFWEIEKDRSVMDTVRIRVLDALEADGI
ncbi:MAG: hypothetical protein WC340_10805 [Kiritimatiellia bacterium]